MKIALVTGGSRGLGKSMCLHLADKGNDIILTYNTKEGEAREVVASIEKAGRKAVALKRDAHRQSQPRAKVPRQSELLPGSPSNNTTFPMVSKKR